MGDQLAGSDPSLPGVLTPAPVLRDRPRPSNQGFRWWLVVAALVLAAVAAMTWAIVRAPASGTPDLAYPDGPEIPGFATVRVSDQAWDVDDPMRSRQVVLDVKTGSPGELVDFYRTTYALSEGWRPTTGMSDHELCLVKHSAAGPTDILEVLTYRGTRVPVSLGRHLVMISRMQDAGTNPCGAALQWIDEDLL